MDIQISPRAKELIDEYRALFRQIDEINAQILSTEENIRKEVGLSKLKMRAVRRQIKAEGKDAQSSVYFLEAVGHDLMKIGRARDVRSRISSIRSCSPYRLKLMGSIPGEREVEWDAHCHFGEHKKRGEWFHLTPEIRQQVHTIISEGTVPAGPLFNGYDLYGYLRECRYGK